MKINIKNINKKYLIAGIAIITILILRSFLLRKPNDELTFTVEKGSLVDVVHVSGTYVAAAQTKVISPTNGIISELYVKNNDQVNKGDSLFYIESTASYEEKASAYSNYLSAINNLKTAKQNKESYDASMWIKHNALLNAQVELDSMNDRLSKSEENPATGNAYTDLEIENIKASLTESQKSFSATEKQYKEADTSIAAAQAAVNSTKLAYDATKSIVVKAPATGKIVNLLKTTGSEVTASTTTTIAPPVLIIANLENPSITAKISEAYVARLSEGQKVNIVFDVATDQVFEGYIETIDTVGTDLAGIVTYDARVSIENITSFIKPNMSNTLSIETFRKDDVFSVPNSAILFKNGKTYVRRVGSIRNKAEEEKNLIEIELGAKGLVKTEVINGLSQGLEIVADIGSN